MTRTLLVLLCAALVLLALYGMLRGWRARATRQGELPPLPEPPAAAGEPIATLTGLYVGSAFATSWQDRVVAGGLGQRADMTASLFAAGVLVERQGTSAVWIPADAWIGARLAPGLAGKVVGAGGLLVLRWRLGEADIDTGLRADDKTAYPTWVASINGRVRA